MKATKIEVRTKALRAGQHVDGVWQPAGQLVATVYVLEPTAVEDVRWRLETGEGEQDSVARVVGREEITE